MISELDQVNIFMGLTYVQLENVASFCTRRVYDDGDILIEEGDDRNADLYILLHGTVEIVSSSARTTSSEVVLSREDKQVFGEISWLSGDRRTAGVRCNGQVEAIRVDGQALMHYLEQAPEAGFVVMRQIAILLAQRMSDSNRLLKQLLWNRDI